MNREIDPLVKLVLAFYMSHGQNEFKEAATNYFDAHLHDFLALPPEAHASMCRTCGISEAEFIAVCQRLMMLAPSRSGVAS